MFDSMIAQLPGIGDGIFSIWTSSTFLAQDASSSPTSILGLLKEIETAKLLFLLIFGTGLVSAAGYAISTVVRAFNASPDESEEITQRIASLEARMSQLENRTST